MDDIIGYITGTKAPPVGLDLIYLEAQRYVIPACAMRVQRTQEMAPPVAFTPDGRGSEDNFTIACSKRSRASTEKP